MIVRENKEVVTLCDITTGETFKYRDMFYMVVCFSYKAQSGWICQIKSTTLVEKVDCICNIRSNKNEK